MRNTPQGGANAGNAADDSLMVIQGNTAVYNRREEDASKQYMDLPANAHADALTYF